MLLPKQSQFGKFDPVRMALATTVVDAILTDTKKGIIDGLDLTVDGAIVVSQF